MPDYLFEPVTPSVAIDGSAQRFPVRRIYCVGRNYAEHAREMGHDPDREAPFFFNKAADSVVASGATVAYPAASADVHHEIELVVAIGRGGRDIDAASALEHVFGYAVGLDLTRRDLQAQAKKLGRPWSAAKAFDHAAPCSAIVPAARIGHPDRGRIWLEVNGDLRQQGDLSDMIWSVGEILAQLSALFELQPGDLVFTGTPAGVGAVQRGDRLAGGIDGIGRLELGIE